MPDDLEARVERIVKRRRRAIALLLLALVGSIASTVGMIFWLAARHWRAVAEAPPPIPAPASNPPAPAVPHDAPASPASGDATPATLSGVVRLRGEPPARATLKMATDPFCAKKGGEDDSA